MRRRQPRRGDVDIEATVKKKPSPEGSTLIDEIYRWRQEKSHPIPGLEQADFSEVRRLAADETSKARGHDYITLVADADQRRVLFVAEGKDAPTIKAFASDFAAHGGDPQAVKSISIDMSPAFI